MGGVRTSRQDERPLMLHGAGAKHSLLDLRLIGRMVVAPVAIDAFARIELAGRGVLTAAIAAYTTFVATQLAVVYWGRWQLQRARVRLAAARASVHRRRVPITTRPGPMIASNVANRLRRDSLGPVSNARTTPSAPSMSPRCARSRTDRRSAGRLNAPSTTLVIQQPPHSPRRDRGARAGVAACCAAPRGEAPLRAALQRARRTTHRRACDLADRP